MRRTWTSIATALALALAACSSGGGDAAGRCESVTDCEAGQVCLDGVCSAPVDGGSCAEGCECVIDAQCVSPHACVESRCVDGLCFSLGMDALCSAGERCTVEEGCVAIAPPDAGPPPDATPPDASPGDAGPTDAGPVDAGAPDAGPVTSVGTACRGAADCDPIAGQAPVCLGVDGGFVVRSFSGGYCSRRCDDAMCGDGAACVRLSLFIPYCLLPCEADAECRTREGYACREVREDPGGQRYCIPTGVTL